MAVTAEVYPNFDAIHEKFGADLSQEQIHDIIKENVETVSDTDDELQACQEDQAA